MHQHDASCFAHTFSPFCFMRRYACHACLCHTLAFYASLHTYLYVHAWVLLASVSSMIQHNEVMDIWSPRGHHLLFACLSACFLACLPFCLFACCLVSLFAMPIMLICFMSFHMLLASFPSIVCLLVSCLCLCMYTHGTRMLGVRAWSPRRKQKGCRREHMVKPSGSVQ